MFKSIQWKIIAIFLLLTVSVMIVVGTFLLQNISSYYHNDFAVTMSGQAFVPSVERLLSEAAASEQPVEKMSEVMTIYSVRMGIDSFRNYYILDGETAAVLGASDINTSKVTVTPNIILAMNALRGDTVDRSASYMDFALPITEGEDVRYIIYVIDTKEEMYDVMRNIFVNILWALLFGLILSAFLGFFLSRTIIAPISTLQFRAEAMAEGDFGHKIEVRSRDELGRLTMAFNEMAARLNATLRDIAAEKNKVETVLRSQNDAVVAFSSSGEIMHINPAAEKLLGEYAGLPFDAMFAKIGTDITLSRVLYLKEDATFWRDVEINKRNLKAFFAPFNIETMTGAGVVVVFQDITEHLRLDNSRREFVANVSHELRTPLTTIKSYTETIMDMTTDSAQTEFLKVIDNEADRMTRIVKDLLTLSQLDYSQKLNKTSFDLGALAQSVTKKLGIDAKNHRHNLQCICEGESLVFADKDRIEQVITNIISNAIKYTPDGGEINVKCTQKIAAAQLVVSDNGMGIPEVDLPRIFERFYRVDKARSRESGGTGLGLAIAKEIVELHGGKIKIESPKRKGTIVTIVLPLFS
ncbi:MAG: ATP-binding protein [Clostridia bacterium]|nr:ATP-binding protein [Clostridia bacterium]